MPEITFPLKKAVFNNKDGLRRLAEYYGEQIPDDPQQADSLIIQLVARIYSGIDITPLYKSIHFTHQGGPDPYVFDVEIVAVGEIPGSPANIKISSLSVKQLIASSLAYLNLEGNRPELEEGVRKTARQAEAEVHEISRVTLEITEGEFGREDITKVSLTNNCTPAPAWELSVFIIEDGAPVEYHGSFKAELETGEDSLPYAQLRRSLKGYGYFEQLYQDYTSSNPNDHLTEGVVIVSAEYEGKGLQELVSATEIVVKGHESEPIDFGLFPECKSKAIERGILPEPSNAGAKLTRRWALTAVDNPVSAGRFEVHARKPDGQYLTFEDIYSYSAQGQFGQFWLPHFDGRGLYYPIAIPGFEEPHLRPLDSLQLLKRANIRLHSYDSDPRGVFLTGEITVFDAPEGTALQKLIFGNIPISDIPHEGDGLYRGPTLNINRLNVAPRKKIQSPDLNFEPIKSDHPLYAFILGKDDQLIENTAFGVEQLHLQFRDGRLHVWLISFERVIPVFHGSLELPVPFEEKE